MKEGDTARKKDGTNFVGKHDEKLLREECTAIMMNETLWGSRLVRLAIAALAALLLALAAQIALPMMRANAEKIPVFKSVPVPANQSWTDTGVQLKDGDVLTITATGSMRPNWTGG